MCVTSFFYLHFFHDSNPSRPLINRLKYFRIQKYLMGLNHEKNKGRKSCDTLPLSLPTDWQFGNFFPMLLLTFKTQILLNIFFYRDTLSKDKWTNHEIMNDKYQDVPEHCGQWRIRNTIPYMNGCKYKWERHDKQGWEFALLLLSIFIVNRFCRSFKKNDESKMSGLFFSLFRSIEQFALYESDICSFYERALLLFEEKSENWTYITNLLLCSGLGIRSFALRPFALVALYKKREKSDSLF